MAATWWGIRIIPSTMSWHRRDPSVIASAAKQSIEPQTRYGLLRRGACHRARIRATRWLLAMTVEGAEGANGKSSTSSGRRIRPMPVRKSRLRNRRAGALGLARSFTWQPSRAWRGLCDLCRELAQALSDHQRQDRDLPLRGCGHKNRAQFLRTLRHALDLRMPALAAHDQHSARVVFGSHRPAAALSHRDRGVAGMGLHRRAAGAPKGFSRRGLAAIEKEKARRRRPL